MRIILIGIALFILFFIFGIRHRIVVKCDLLNIYVFIDYLPILWLKNGKIWKYILNAIYEKKKIDPDSISYIHLLEPLENVVLRVKNYYQDRFDINVFVNSIIVTIRQYYDVDVIYEEKEGKDKIVIELFLIVYIPKFVHHILKIRREIHARKINQ